MGDNFYAPLRRAKGKQEKQDQQAAFIREVAAKLKYDAFVPGELDIKPDLEALMAFHEETKIPILAGNMVDPDSGKILFGSSRIIERSGIRIALVGVLGPSAFEVVPANEDFNPKAAKSMKTAGMNSKSAKAAKSLQGTLAKLKEQGEKSGATAEQIATLTAALEGKAAQIAASEETEEEEPVSDYKGRRFKITDPVAYALKELTSLHGKADLYVLCGHMTKQESDDLRQKAAGYHLFLDGHGQGKSRYFKDEGNAPHRIRGGNRGRSLTLAKVLIKDGNFEFENRSSFERDQKSLARQKKSLERLIKKVGGEEVLADLPEDDRQKLRIGQLEKRIADLEAKLTPAGSGSYFETQQISLDSKIVGDAEIEMRQKEIAGTKSTNKKMKPKMVNLKKEGK